MGPNPANGMGCTYVEIWQNLACGGMRRCAKVRYCGNLCDLAFVIPDVCEDDEEVHEDVFEEDP
jgi:hypothetical protein